MLEFGSARPDVDVQEAEYHRLLGLPCDYEAEGRVRELAEWARRWYREHGQPWWYARRIDGIVPSDGMVTIGGTTFASPRLGETLSSAGADSAVVAAVSAGRECEEYGRRLWDEGKPDEYLFLEVFGSAVVEALVAAVAYRLCEWADGQALAVLPHYSPGYPEWDITDQRRLFDLAADGAAGDLSDRLSVLETGMLRPKKSLLAVFGITPHAERVRRLTSLVPCEQCALAGCRYRRARFRRPMPSIDAMAPVRSGARDGAELRSGTGAVLARGASYSMPSAALEKWSRERLRLRVLPDRTIAARFRYEGTTCSNLGQPLAFDYHVHLSSPETGLTVTEARCDPAPEDSGYTSMCRYLVERSSFLETIAAERPLIGCPLDDVLAWRREPSPAGCFCDARARAHKWGLVFEVLHYTLAKPVTDDPA